MITVDGNTEAFRWRFDLVAHVVRYRGARLRHQGIPGSVSNWIVFSFSGQYSKLGVREMHCRIICPMLRLFCQEQDNE